MLRTDNISRSANEDLDDEERDDESNKNVLCESIGIFLSSYVVAVEAVGRLYYCVVPISQYL
jgi:hypothetical protein